MPRRHILSARQRSALLDLPTDEASLLRHYILADDDLIHVDVVSGRGRDTLLQGVSVYDRSVGTLNSIVSGKDARMVGDAWRLREAVRFDAAKGTETDLGTVDIEEDHLPPLFRQLLQDIGLEPAHHDLRAQPHMQLVEAGAGAVALHEIDAALAQAIGR